MREPPGPVWGRAASLCLLGLAAACAGGRRGVLSGRAAGCARGRRPAREPSAPRASLGASPRSPARPRHRPRAPQPGPTTAHRHRGGLQSVGACRLCVDRPCRRPPAPRPGPPVPPAPSTPVEPGVLMIGSARRLDARPGPAAAHGHRSQAPPAPRLGRPNLPCPPGRPNRLRTRIGYCDMDRL